jgi:hypothetical protein
MSVTEPPPEPTPGPVPEPSPAAGVHPTSTMWSARFWMLTAERAVKTAAQTFAVLLLAKAGDAGGVDIASVDWATAVILSAGAAVLSIVTSLASRPIGPDPDTPSVLE